MPSPNVNENLLEQNVVRVKDVNNNWSGWINVELPSSVRSKYYNTSSVRTPDFRRLKKRQYPENPYIKYDNSSADPRKQLTYTTAYTSGSNAGKTTISDYLINCKGARFPVTPPSWGGTDVLSRTQSKLLKQMSTTVSNLSVTIGEAHMTAKMITQSATKILKAVKALKNFRLGEFGNALGITVTRSQELRFGRKKKILVDQLWADEYRLVKGPKKYRYGDQRILRLRRESPRVQDFMASTWLEYKYGWTPLLSDVYDQAKALATHMVDRSNVVRRESTKLSEEDTAFISYTDPGNKAWTLDAQRVEKRSVFQFVKYYIPEGQIKAQDTFGLNNPLLLAWELVPFSFVADWFLPIGGALEQLTATNGLVFYGSARSVKIEKKLTYNFYGNGTAVVVPNGFSVASGLVTDTVSEFSLTRQAVSSFPSPQWPEFRTPKSWQQALTSISLLQAVFLRKK